MKKLICFCIVLSLFQSCNNQFHELEDGLYANIETNKGSILIKLAIDKAPITAANFVSLSEGNNPIVSETYKSKMFYNGLKFHRVIENFMIQGGDPLGVGSGGPGYRFDDEFSDIRHDGPGILSMANSGPGTNGSQFFITHKATPWLDGKHSVFGKVVEGQNIVDSIEQNDVINRINIIRKGKLADQFDAPKIFKSHFEEKIKNDKIAYEAEKKKIKELTIGMQKTETGLFYTIKDQGKGPKPQEGTKVEVHYVGSLINGTIFDSSYERNKPIEFILGVGQVIKGWDEGIMLMKKKSKARFVIPSELAYGSRGAGGVIPPNATLIFDVELINFN